jgi:hypothetical protein
MTVASISRASMASKSTIYKVAITITAGNVVAYSTSRSRKSSTWRPSIGTAERTIGSAIPPSLPSHGRLMRTDAIIHCRSSSPKPACNHTTNRALITTSAKSVGATLMMRMNYGNMQRRTTMPVGYAKRSVALFVPPPPDKRNVGNAL